MLQAGIALVAALAVVMWWRRGDDAVDRLAEHLRCLAIVGQVMQENQGHWPDDIVAAALRVPEAAVHVTAAEELTGRPSREFIVYQPPGVGSRSNQTVISADFRDARIVILANGTVDVTR